MVVSLELQDIVLIASQLMFVPSIPHNVLVKRHVRSTRPVEAAGRNELEHLSYALNYCLLHILLSQISFALSFIVFIQ